MSVTVVVFATRTVQIYADVEVDARTPDGRERSDEELRQAALEAATSHFADYDWEEDPGMVEVSDPTSAGVIERMGPLCPACDVGEHDVCGDVPGCECCEESAKGIEVQS